MKYILLIVLGLSSAFNAHASETAGNIYEIMHEKVITVPSKLSTNSSNYVDILALFEYSNQCHMNGNLVLVKAVRPSLQGVLLDTFTKSKADELICPAIYQPVSKWVKIGHNLEIGSTMVVNGQKRIVTAPVPAICTKDMCRKPGQVKNPFTCQCESINVMQ